MSDTFDITAAEKEHIERARASGKPLGPAKTGAAAGQEAGATKPPSEDDMPVTRAELAAREQAQLREQRANTARQTLSAASQKVMANAEGLGTISDEKRQYLEGQAFLIAGKKEGVATMTPAQMTALVEASTQEAIAAEIAERGGPAAGAKSKEDLDKRLEAGTNAADRSGTSGSGGSASGADGGDQAKAVQSVQASERDMEFGPGVDMDWPTEESVKQRRGEAADAFLAKAYGDKSRS